MELNTNSVPFVDDTLGYPMKDSRRWDHSHESKGPLSLFNGLWRPWLGLTGQQQKRLNAPYLKVGE